MESLAYLNGVLHGDGWHKQALGLRVADKDFAEAFCAAIFDGTGITLAPRLDERGYWLVRSSAAGGRFQSLVDFVPETETEKCAWVRGLFDSEGNAQLAPMKNRTGNCFNRRIAMYSTNLATLERALLYCAEVDLPFVLRVQKHSRGHLGTKQVYELGLRASKSNYARFLALIGTNIERKRKTIEGIVDSYVADPTASYRAAQLLGAKARAEKTMNETLPFVLKEIRLMIEQGVKPSQKAYKTIRGYNTLQRYFSQAELTQMATELR